MTTATRKHRTTTVASTVFAALLCTAGIGLLLVATAAVVAGAPAALGAVTGAVMVCVFFAAGALVLNAVTSISPAASLLIAMLTYTLKIVLIGLVFVALSQSGALEGSLDARWLGGTVIVCTLTWLTAQVVTSMRARVPVYDLPAAEAEAGAR